MELERHLDRLREQLAAAAESGEEARALAQRLTAQLDSAARLMLLDALGVAAAEITRDLAPGSVELRLRGGDPEFVVTAPPADPEQATGPGDALNPGEAWAAVGPSYASGGTGEGGMARINLRLPDELKSRVEQAADREGISINAWLVRAAAAVVGRGEAGTRREAGTPRGGQRYTGWGR
ncbi:MAG: toxin-antitoxin system HicB family antitoxin [Solirubrobacteraceae bacterium]